MKNKIFCLLGELGIEYENFEHEEVFSCDDAKGVDIPGERVKSLLLRNKHKTKFYMVVLGEAKKLQTQILRSSLGENKLSFTSEEDMLEKIGVKIGSVSPFALINNKEKDITVIFDVDLEGVKIGFHPLQNDNTTVLSMNDVEKFLDSIGISYQYIGL